MFVRSLLVHWLTALVLGAPSLAAAATILVFGDSLSSAYGLQRDEGWTTLLQRRLDGKKFDYRVANASISGETTHGGRIRIVAALKAHRPSIVIIALGGNDGLRGLGVETMRTNLEAVVQAARASGAQVLLVGMHMPPNFGPDYVEKFRQAYRAVAMKEGVALVPFLLEGFAERQDMFQPDGIHPTAAAQPLMLENVWKVLQPLLKKP
jgi:acyl-CoA thioesterase-1